MFTAKDKETISSKGLTLEDVEKQLRYFRQGFPPLDILGPAVPGNGITCFSKEEQNRYAGIYDAWNGSRIKFVPASGAASRMFMDLFKARELLQSGNQAELPESVRIFFERLSSFAFFPLLSGLKGFDPLDRVGTLDLLLNKQGLHFAHLPKGLIPFHRYPNGPRTPFEEHLVEAALSFAESNRTARVHFTVSEEHLELFQELWEKTRENVEKRFGLEFLVGFSTQSPSTDTLAVTSDNMPFRKQDGTLVFRPGGHGALLKNLQELNQDLVAIRNIDNVVPERLLGPVIHWRKVLAGYLIQCREQVHTYSKKLEHMCLTASDSMDPLLEEVAGFLERVFGVTHPVMETGNVEALRSYLLSQLNRPIRVCGMVPVTGEPGGGPFRILEKDGSSSLQILEGVQLDGKKYNATHFNPVDMVCSMKDHQGVPYDLQKFSDNDTGFISHKTMEGRELKALELPGLWNGGMSRWNTVFVEVPLSTFNPVKTVMDLLRKEHNN